MASKKGDDTFRKELDAQKQAKQDHEMAKRMQAEMNQGAGGQMMDDDDDMMGF